MLPVMFQRGALQLGRLAAFDPVPSGFRDGEAAALGGMGPGPHINRDDGVIGVGVALAGEGLDVPGPLWSL